MPIGLASIPSYTPLKRGIGCGTVQPEPSSDGAQERHLRLRDLRIRNGDIHQSLEKEQRQLIRNPHTRW